MQFKTLALVDHLPSGKWFIRKMPHDSKFCNCLSNSNITDFLKIIVFEIFFIQLIIYILQNLLSCMIALIGSGCCAPFWLLCSVLVAVLRSGCCAPFWLLCSVPAAEVGAVSLPCYYIVSTSTFSAGGKQIPLSQH